MQREKKERSIKTVEQSKRKSANEASQNQEPSIQWISSIFVVIVQSFHWIIKIVF